MVQQKGTTERYLQHLVNNVGKALEQGGLLVEQTAQIYAPRYTGRMEGSVGHTPARLIDGRLEVLVGPGPEAPYGKYTEMDEYLHDKKLGPNSVAKGTSRMPWLGPALRDNRSEIAELIIEAIRNTRA